MVQVLRSLMRSPDCTLLVTESPPLHGVTTVEDTGYSEDAALWPSILYQPGESLYDLSKPMPEWSVLHAHKRNKKAFIVVH